MCHNDLMIKEKCDYKKSFENNRPFIVPDNVGVCIIKLTFFVFSIYIQMK